MEKIVFEKLNKMDYQTRESYKVLRANLQFCGSDVKSILFTSSKQSEGKSSVAFNIAVQLANGGKKVVFVDADLRKSIIVGKYKLSGNIMGISHYLSGQCALDEVIYDTNIPNLQVILCSKYPPNPAELLGHVNLKVMIQMLRENNDYVIIDSPPLGEVIDSAIIAPYCDGAVIVIEANKTNHRDAVDVKKQLDRSGCKVLGAILNKVPMNKGVYIPKYPKYYGNYYKENTEA